MVLQSPLENSTCTFRCTRFWLSTERGVLRILLENGYSLEVSQRVFERPCGYAEDNSVRKEGEKQPHPLPSRFGSA